jgi:hydroxymethylpyrimidine kinase/phosphomethylpyrimidine kinase
MRQPAPHRPPVALTVAGSDSGGGAGVQADLKTMAAHGAFPTSAVTAVTAQNTVGVHGSHVLPAADVDDQLAAVTADFDVRAAKTGMLATRSVIETATGFAADFGGPLVVDPVMVAASGDRLLEPAAEDAYEDLLAHAALATPNVDEAAVLTGRDIEDAADAAAAAEAVVEMGADAALVTGGHLGGDRVADVLATGDGTREFTHARVDTDATHGSGCTVSAAIAARLAHGDPLEAAVGDAIAFMTRAVRHHVDVGEGPGAVHHLAGLREDAARDPTAEAVAGVVDRLLAADVTDLVPEVGMNVAGATPFAEHEHEVAAVDGRLRPTRHGLAPGNGVAFGASGHVARFLLGVREFAPDRRFACNCRFDDGVAAAIEALGWPVAEVDRAAQPADVAGAEGSTMEWAARQAFGDGSRPVAVVDRGAVGKEPMCRVVTDDATALGDRVLALADAL